MGSGQQEQGAGRQQRGGSREEAAGAAIPLLLLWSIFADAGALSFRRSIRGFNSSNSSAPSRSAPKLTLPLKPTPSLPPAVSQLVQRVICVRSEKKKCIFQIN